MKHKIDLIFMKPPKMVNAKLYPKDNDGQYNEPFDINKHLRELFDNAKEGPVYVRIIADDWSEIEKPFDCETANEILAGHIIGRFTSCQGDEVTIFDTTLKDDFPVAGKLNNRIMTWNSSGHCSDGEPGHSLKIYIKNEERGK